MDYQSAPCNRIRPAKSASQCGTQQNLAQPFALLDFIQREPGHQNDGQGIVSLSLTDAGWSIVDDHGSGRQTGVSNHLGTASKHIRSRATAGMILESVPDEKIIERGFAAIEIREIMVAVEQKPIPLQGRREYD